MPWNAADMVSGSPSLRARISTLSAISQYPQLILIAHAKVIHMPGKRAYRTCEVLVRDLSGYATNRALERIVRTITTNQCGFGAWAFGLLLRVPTNQIACRWYS